MLLGLGASWASNWLGLGALVCAFAFTFAGGIIVGWLGGACGCR